MARWSPLASALARAHIEAERRLRELIRRAVGQAWRNLPDYHERNVDEWLSRVVPLVLSGQRTSISLTDAYIARTLGRQPLGLDQDAVISRLRGPTSPDEVYRRPFVRTWTALSKGTEPVAAIAAGYAQAVSSAAMDVQMAMAATLQEVGQADETITGWQRVANANACQFCSLVDGAKLNSADPMPLHNGCGCGVEVLTDPFSPTPPPEGVAIHEHGELGPVLADPAHDFTSPADL